MFDREDKQSRCEYQNKAVIELLVKNKKLNIVEATKLWYSSKTKKALQDGTEDFSYVAPTRCLDELDMEIQEDARWMKESFE